MRFPSIVVLLFTVALPRITFSQPSARLGLPFSTEETTGTVTVAVRHKVSWNRPSGKVSWKQLELEVPNHLKLKIDPGTYSPKDKKPMDVGFQLAVQKGSLNGNYQLRDDKTWAMQVRTELQPRDVHWGKPEVRINEIGVDADLALDTQLEGPLPTLKTLDVRKLEIGDISAGPFTGKGIAISGSWARPDWKLNQLEGQIFGGTIRAEGSGTWGTNVPTKVSISLETDGLDLQALLRAFNVRQADQIQAKLRGKLLLEAEGREWKQMSLDIANKEPAYLDRKFIHDVLEFSMRPLGEEESARFIKSVEDALTASYGDAQVIPFQNLSLSGGLTPGTLNLRLPLHNEALKIDVEPRIDRELVWDAWDYLLDEGIKNIGVELKKQPKDAQDK